MQHETTILYARLPSGDESPLGAYDGWYVATDAKSIPACATSDVKVSDPDRQPRLLEISVHAAHQYGDHVLETVALINAVGRPARLLLNATSPIHTHVQHLNDSPIYLAQFFWDKVKHGHCPPHARKGTFSLTAALWEHLADKYDGFAITGSNGKRHCFVREEFASSLPPHRLAVTPSSVTHHALSTEATLG